MNRITRAIGGVFEKTQRRFARSRPASVLILTVGLLVLIMLIGIAFLSMAQSDRAASVQHENNTEIDLLLDGMVNLVKANVIADLFAQGQFRPAAGYDTGQPGTYNHFTGLGDPDVSGVAATKFLASRVPELPGENPTATVAGVAASGNQPFWRFLTAPILGGRFASPLPAAGKTFLLGQVAGDPSSSYTQRSSISQRLYPSFMPMGGKLAPVWVDNPDNPAGWVMAADADGDGIPDSGMVKLPIGTINGVTYYVSIRIVDNNAAVNANVAWQHNPYMARPNPPLPGDFFPSNIDLLDMLVGADANVNAPTGINQLLAYRFSQNSRLLATLPGTGQFGFTAPNGADNPPDNTTAYDDTGSYHGDLKVYPYLEASWNGLGRRLRNPGAWSAGGVANFPLGSPGSPIQFSVLPIGEATSLARQFVIADPTQRSSLLGLSLPQSLYQNSPVQPYQASPASPVQWFNQNFGFLASRYWATDPAKSTMPVRSILASENSVSNFCPSKFRDMGTMPDTWPKPGASLPTFLFGDSILWKGHRYVCINPAAASSGADGTSPVDPMVPIFRFFGPLPNAWNMDNDTWVYQAWTTSPVKTAVNTATFGQLYLAYWSVMAEQYRTADHDWAPGFPAAISPGGPIPPTPITTNPSPRMFRNPIRVAPSAPSATTWQLSPVQVMQLRAALAAVNTVDMRLGDGANDVTGRTVHLIDFDPVSQPNLRMHDVIATVYGLQPQPLITRVYATNAQVSEPSTGITQPGFVAIELYNPDPVQSISLCGYALATIQRPGTGPSATPPNCNPTPIPWGPDPAWFAGTAPTIPPHGFIVVASNSNPPSGITLPSSPVFVHNLVPPGGGGALGNELMLFRPRFQDDNGVGPLVGTPSASPVVSGFRVTGTPAPTPPGPVPLTSQPQRQPYPAYCEGTVDLSGNYTPNPADMVPIDSYDFTGFPPGPANPATVWYYVRPSDPNANPGKSWHFVYPGHYVITATPRLIDGTLLGSPGTAIAPMGVPQSSPANVAYKDIPLQLHNLDFAGPGVERLSKTGPQVVAFPYGGFARNGDILQVPFIGSYRLEIPDSGGTGNAVVLEMNPVTIDSVMALGLSQGNLFNEPSESLAVPNLNGNLQTGLNDPICDLSGSSIENIGRFCPLDPVDLGLKPTDPAPINDFASASPGAVSPLWLYHFGTRLFDYLTVQSPQQDLTPEADEGETDIYIALNKFGGQEHEKGKYGPPGETVSTFPPAAVANVTGRSAGVFNAEPRNPNNATEETVPTEGLININTAPWRVLAAVPWVGPDFPAFNGSPTGNRLATNVNIGLSIAYYRDVDDGTVSGVKHPHGPFHSIFELNNVPVYPAVSSAGIGAPYTLFRDLLKNGATVPAPYNQNQGNITPGYAPDTVVGDFKTKFTMMDRASNLITTRSDSFTAYILLQGWRDAETPGATLAVQRRAAFLIDRSGITPANVSSPTINFVPNQ